MLIVAAVITSFLLTSLVEWSGLKGALAVRLRCPKNSELEFELLS